MLCTTPWSICLMKEGKGGRLLYHGQWSGSEVKKGVCYQAWSIPGTLCRRRACLPTSCPLTSIGITQTDKTYKSTDQSMWKITLVQHLLISLIWHVAIHENNLQINLLNENSAKMAGKRAGRRVKQLGKSIERPFTRSWRTLNRVPTVIRSYTRRIFFRSWDKHTAISCSRLGCRKLLQKIKIFIRDRA